MALNPTDLRIQSAPLPQDFEGSPQALFTAMIERMKIVSPSGSATFVTGDTMPTSNVGPWLRGGTQWWVFDVDSGTYVPLDIEESEKLPFFLGPTDPGTPSGDDPLVWLKTSGNRAIEWYGWTGSEWRVVGHSSVSGPTSERPTAPEDLEEYFDTDINVLIHWERSAWRTVSGSPGDVKQVTATILADALEVNPGWQLLGISTQSQRGRVLGMAVKDPGGAPAASYATDSGITARYAGEEYGEETHVLTSDEIESHSHLIGHASALNSGDTGQFHRVDDGEDVALPTPVPPNYFEINGSAGNGTKTGSAGLGPTGTMFITTRQLTLAAAPNYTSAAEPHNTMQPTLFLWTLVKE